MKRTLIYLAILFGFTFIGCEKETDSENEKEYQFEATVIGKGLDCGDTYLIDLKITIGNSDIVEGTYYADDLSSDLKVVGLKIKLNCRKPNDDELYVCTTMGPSYSHVIVIDAE